MSQQKQESILLKTKDLSGTCQDKSHQNDKNGLDLSQDENGKEDSLDTMEQEDQSRIGASTSDIKVLGFEDKKSGKARGEEGSGGTGEIHDGENDKKEEKGVGFLKQMLLSGACFSTELIVTFVSIYGILR